MARKVPPLNPAAQEQLDESINSALRVIAGWSSPTTETRGRLVIRERLVHYDANGNITGATDRLYEEDTSQNYGR